MKHRNKLFAALTAVALTAVSFAMLSISAEEQEREENTKLLLAVSISQNELPKQSIRNKINGIC